jgi:alpha-galactosidase
MAVLCSYLHATRPERRVLGLCHSVPLTIEMLAGWAGVPPEDVSFFLAGVNHKAHLLEFEHDGVGLHSRRSRGSGRRSAST